MSIRNYPFGGDYVKKVWIIAVGVLAVLVIAYIMIGRRLPIHRSEFKVGSERIYYIETSKRVHCDIETFEIVVYEDAEYEYIYELISVGNGSCKSELYIWHNLKSYVLSEAIEDDLIPLDNFLDSDFVIKRPITSE